LPIRNGFVLADFFLYLPTVFLVISFLPVLAAQARRLRDAGFSHWWLLLIIIPYMGWFILLILLVYPTRSAYVAN
jgi:Predicted membrane protein